MNNSVVTIYTPTGQERAAIRLGEGSVRTRTLDGTDEVVIKDSVNTRLDLHIGDYVVLDEGRFVLCEHQTPTVNDSNGALDYTLRFEAPYHLWKNHIFKLNPTIGATEVSWTLTATLKEHMTVFLKNLEMLHEQESTAGYDHYNYRFDDGSAGGLKYAFAIQGNGKTPVTTSEGMIVDTLEAKVITYNNVSLLDALTMMAEAWAFEWWVENGTIYFGRCESGESVALTEGDNVALMKPTTSKSDYATRIYGFGGTQNISGKYRKHLVFDATNVTSEGAWDAARPIDNTFITDVVSGTDITPDTYTFESGTSAPVTPIDDTDGWKRCSLTAPRGRKCFLICAGSEPITVRGGYRLIMDISAKISSSQTLESAYLMCLNQMNGKSEEAAISGETRVVLNTTASVTTIMDWTFNIVFTAEQDASVDVYFKINKLRLEPVDIYPDVSVTITKNGSTSSATLHAGDDNIYRFVGGGLSLGDKFTISSPNINEAFIPTSYYSSSNTDENVLRGLAEKRLLLPTEHPYVDVGENLTPAEVVELAVVVDSIYPRQDLVVTLEGVAEPVYSDTTYDTDESGNKTPRIETYYRFRTNVKDTTTPFMLPSKAVIADEFRVQFTTGKLAGMTFKCYIKEDGYYEVIQSEDYGTPLPNGDLYPQAGDGVVFLGWDTAYFSGTDLDEIAENKLYEYISQYAQEIVLDTLDYDCTLHVDYALDHSYVLGQKVTLKSPFYFSPEGRESRVIGITFPLDVPYDNPVYTVGESGKTSRLGDMERQIEGLAYTLSEVQAGGVTTSVVGGRSIVIIRMGSTITPSDENVFSALRAINMFLRKDTADTALGRITFAGGLTSTNVDVNGNTETDTLVVNEYVDGDLNVHGDVESTGDVSGTNVEASNNITAGGNVTADGNVSAGGNVSGTDVVATNEVRGKDIKAEESLEIGDYVPSAAGIGGKGGKVWVDENGYSHAVFDVLNVNQQMHVTELIVERARSVGGTLVISPANMEVGSVEWLTADADPAVNPQSTVTKDTNLVQAFKLYFENEDSEKEITNEWAVGDLAFCRTWNIKEGTTKDYENKYYRRRVTAVGENYIILSMATADDLTLARTIIKVDKPEGNPTANGYYEIVNDEHVLSADTTVDPSKTYYKFLTNQSTWPSAGDHISVLGNDTDRTRQNAIVISAYGENAPSEFDYEGISTFELPEPIFAKYWDPTVNKDGVYGAFVVKIGNSNNNYVMWDGSKLTVVGDFSTSSGTNVQNALNTLNNNYDALGTRIDSIVGQDDGTFQIWFGDDVPTLLNEPASAWNTSELMALHDQDIYYSRTLGGRAWRFQYDSTNQTGAWVEITDQYVLQALAEATAAKTAVDNLADDGILSAGSEKAQLLISWKDVESTYIQYPPQAQDHIEWLDPDNHGTGTSTTTDEAILLARDLYASRNTFITAVKTLGNWLNGKGESDTSTTYDLAWPAWTASDWGTGTIPTPAYIGAAFTSDTRLTDYGQTKAGYRDVWTNYYSSLNELLKLLTAAGKLKTQTAQNTANKALHDIAQIAEDGQIEASEIPSLRREFEAVYRERYKEGGMIDLATDDATGLVINTQILTPYQAYNTAWQNLTYYLNRGVVWTEPSTYSVPLSDAQFPDLLNPQTDESTVLVDNWTSKNPDGGAAFRNLWATFTSAQVALANAISQLAKDTADGAQEDIDDMGDDLKLTPSEKIGIKRDFLCFWSEMCETGGLLDKGRQTNAQSTDYVTYLGWKFLESPQGYITKFNALGTYLNGGTSWSFYTTDLDGQKQIAESNLPSWINADIAETTTIVPADYRAAWSEFSTERFKYLAMLTAHAQAAAEAAAAGVDPATLQSTIQGIVNDAIAGADFRSHVFTSKPTTGYNSGDIWRNVQDNGSYQLYGNATGVTTAVKGKTLVAMANMGSSFSWADWAILDVYSTSGIENVNGQLTLYAKQADLDDVNEDLTEKYNQLQIDVNGIEAIAQKIEFDSNNKITNINTSGLVLASNFATLFANQATAQEIASQAYVATQINNSKPSIIAEVSDSVSGEVSTIKQETDRISMQVGDIAARDNIFTYPEWLVDTDTNNSWNMTTGAIERNTDANLSNNDYGIINLETYDYGANVDLYQEVSGDVIQRYGTDYLCLSIYVQRNPNATRPADTSTEKYADHQSFTILISNLGTVKDYYSHDKATFRQGTDYVEWVITDDDVHRVWVVFSLSGSHSTITFRSHHSSSTSGGVTTILDGRWIVSRPKLEYSTKGVTEWVAGQSALKRAGIDIEKGKIRLDAETVEVAQDLTIGGNTRVGGFIYNLQKSLTVGMRHTCYNPLDYGNLDYRILSGTTGGPVISRSDNILFPECGSSIVIDNYDIVTGYVNICLPFWHPYEMKSMSGSGQVLVQQGYISNHIGNYISEYNYTEGMDIPEITSPKSTEAECGQYLIHQLIHGDTICRRYLGSIVTIENKLVHDNNQARSIRVYGVKGVWGIGVMNNRVQEWWQFEPWNRGTVVWSLTDSYQNDTASIQWSEGDYKPNLKEAQWIIENMQYYQLDGVGRAYTSEAGNYIETSRRLRGDRIWTRPQQIVLDTRFFNSPTIDEDGMVSSSSNYTNSGMLPFVIPFGYFCRLKLVYDEGYFFWAIEAFGKL